MDIGTYHGIFARAIRECDGHAPLSARFTILDGPDQKALLADAYTGWKGEEEWKAFKEDNKVDDVIEEFSKYRMSLLPGQPEYVSESGIADLPGLHRVYTDAKRLEDVADYDDILFAFDVALENPRILALFQSKWKMILVDEYQDTNDDPVEDRAEASGTLPRNLTCVGDDDQSIYGVAGRPTSGTSSDSRRSGRAPKRRAPRTQLPLAGRDPADRQRADRLQRHPTRLDPARHEGQG